MFLEKAIVLFGDSITQQSFDTQHCGWGAALANMYARRLDVVNRGFSGYNTEMARHLLPKVIRDRDEAKSIRLLTLFLGANDASLREMNAHQHVPLDRYEANLEAMVAYLQSLDFDIQRRLVLISPPRVDADKWATREPMPGAGGSTPPTPRDREDHVVELYVQAMARVAHRHRVPFIDVFQSLKAIEAAGVRMHGQQEQQGGAQSSASVSTRNAISSNADGIVGGPDGWKHYLRDGLHLSAAGNQLLFSLLQNKIVSELAPQCPDLDVDGPMDWPHWTEVDSSNLPASLMTNRQSIS